MASQLKVDTLTGVTTAGSIVVTGEGNSTTTNLQQGLAKCWINAKIISTYATRDSFNCSVTTDHGAGEVTYTYTNNFSNNDYVISHMSKQTGANVGGIGFPAVSSNGSDADDAENAMTTSTCRWQYRNQDSNPAFRDQEIAGHIWMGDLA